MSFVDCLKKRRSYYQIKKDIQVDEKEIVLMIQEVVANTPDAFNMQSARVVVLLNEKHNELWDRVYDAFEGKVAREKTNSFKSGYGTILFFIDEETVKSYQNEYPLYANNFPVWANQANGMVQSNLWVGLRELGLGASLQHYNPVIDETVKSLTGADANWKLIAQMPFGAIESEPEPVEKMDIEQRIRFIG